MAKGEAVPITVNGVQTRRQVPSRDKAELRAAVMDSVHEFTTLRRARLLPILRTKHPRASEAELREMLDEMQPEYPEWDPVVQLGVMAADHSNSPELRRAAMSDQAQYLRPKLKSVEMTLDPESEESRREKAELAARLVSLLDAGAAAKRALVIEVDPRTTTQED